MYQNGQIKIVFNLNLFFTKHLIIISCYNFSSNKSHLGYFLKSEQSPVLGDVFVNFTLLGVFIALPPLCPASPPPHKRVGVDA